MAATSTLATSSSRSLPGPDALLALYDQQERFSARFPDFRREELPHLVRHVDLVGRSGTIIYSDLQSETADSAIDEQIAYFQSLGQAFEWKAYGHDQPTDLILRLGAHGFQIDEHEAIMVLDVGDAPPHAADSNSERQAPPTPRRAARRRRHPTPSAWRPRRRTPRP